MSDETESEEQRAAEGPDPGKEPEPMPGEEPTQPDALMGEPPTDPGFDLEPQAEAQGNAGAEVGAEVIDLAEARTEKESVQSNRDGDGDGEDETGPVPIEQLEPLIECLLFASDKPLSVADLKRLTGEKDSRLIGEALESLIEKRMEAGIQVIGVAGGYALRTNPSFAGWVGKLLAARPVRLSRAMLETLAIVAYRQPITRPEMDEIRGVDCGPVLRTLLDRGLVRIIGKKEEVGRPMLYGTTPEFLRVFSLKDLTELPTLRQFHELSAEHQAKVAAKHGESAADPASADSTAGPSGVDSGASLLGAGAEPISSVLAPVAISPDPDEDEGLLDELDEASELAARAAGPLNPEEPAAEPPSGPK